VKFIRKANVKNDKGSCTKKHDSHMNYYPVEKAKETGMYMPKEVSVCVPL